MSEHEGVASPVVGTAGAPRSDEGQRRLARRVVYGTIAVLAVVVLVQLELWPLTAFRLFSTVRTGTTTSVQLVVVGRDGSEHPLQLPRDQVLGVTSHQFGELPGLSPDERRDKVDSWLRVAGIDPATVSSVQLVRTKKDLGPPPKVLEQKIVLEVAP
ncbi:hypothetical protein [Cellulomonas sp. HZM]|uniref:hypothetical protein n=1 Tax=Cellulomonas sp. HZM TaxID=1454010 RepID=UPI0004932146|nr:hypothetical protein [Cellulomonas sp. HZM]